jgi:hypothetical protein
MAPRAPSLDWIAQVLGDPSGSREEIDRPALRLVLGAETADGLPDNAGQGVALPVRHRRSATLLQLRPKSDR